MQLTDKEQRMLAGEYGYPIQKSMEILVQLGIIYGAEKMIPVSNVHMPGASVVVAGEAGTKLTEKMVANKGIYKARTTLNPAAVDMSCWEKIGFSEATYKFQCRLTNAYQDLGALACHTCTPYLIGNNPRLGEHVAWGESSAIAFVNSVLGARTNREGGPSALAAGITGLVPAYGYHLTENRYGQVQVNVEASLNNIVDYGSLGYWVGRQIENKVPVFTGIPSSVTIDQLKMLGAALASSGSVALFHVVGVTPEAPTLEAAFGPKKPQEILLFGKKELEESEARLNKHQGQEVGLVSLGCPHASIWEIEKIASLLMGKKIKQGVDLWVTTSVPVKAYAERCGFKKIIEEAGGTIVVDTCPILAAFGEITGKKKYPSLVTNSAKLAHYGPGQWGMPTYYGSMQNCIQAALTGKFNS